MSLRLGVLKDVLEDGAMATQRSRSLQVCVTDRQRDRDRDRETDRYETEKMAPWPRSACLRSLQAIVD